MKIYLLSLLAGSIYPLGFAPFNIWPLSLISVILFLHFLEKSIKENLFLIGLFYGVGLCSVGMSWMYVSIHYFGNVDIYVSAIITILFILALALYFSLIGLIYKFLKTSTTVDVLFLFPFSWVFVEIIRSYLFTGFPWLIAGTSLGTSFLDGWTPILGVYGSSLFFVLVASFFYLLIVKYLNKENIIYLTSFFILLILSSLLLKQLTWTHKIGEILISVYQPNLELEEKWSFRGIEKTKDLIEDSIVNAKNSEFIFFPETALIQSEIDLSDWLKDLEEKLKLKDIAQITGIVGEISNHKVTNRVQGFGKAKGYYDKRHLVPFGEYVPLVDYFGKVLNLLGLERLNNITTVPGENYNNIKVGEIRISPAICYEIAFNDLVRKASSNSNLLLTISNDTWFGRSIGPEQHLEIAQIRALEHQMSLIRSTNSGISAIINKKGEIIDRINHFQDYSLKENVDLYRGETPFKKFGNKPVYFILFMILTFLIFNKRTYVHI